jgi:hypothetical protein
MSLLNFGKKDNHPPPNRRRFMLVIGVGTLVGVVALGSTLAASINLNDGSPVEFGQGVTQTTACDSEITVTPLSTFVNETGAGSHKFTSLEISGIDSSSDKCDGKSFIIKAYGESGILNIFNYYEEIENWDEPPTVIQDEDYDTIEIANNGGEFAWISGGTDGDDVIQGPSGNLTNTSFTLSFTSETNSITRTPLALAEEVVRITIESKYLAIPLISPTISTTPQVFVFNPALHVIPELHPNTGVCRDGDIPGWAKLISPNQNSEISIYVTSANEQDDPTLKIFNAAGDWIAKNDDFDEDTFGPFAIPTDSYAFDAAETYDAYFPALTFEAEAGETYFIAVGTCDGNTMNKNLDLGYYYKITPP